MIFFNMQPTQTDDWQADIFIGKVTSMVSWYIRAAVPNHRATDRVDKQMAHNKWLKVPITTGMQNNFQNPILKVFCLHVSSKEAWYKFFF